jgi:hypothetical protein
MKFLWAWIKQNPWRALVLPFTALWAVLAWLLWPTRRIAGPNIQVPEVADLAALHAQKQAEGDREEAILKIEQEKREVLSRASADQLKEYETVRSKSPEDVAKWIDNLS